MKRRLYYDGSLHGSPLAFVSLFPPSQWALLPDVSWLQVRNPSDENSHGTGGQRAVHLSKAILQEYLDMTGGPRDRLSGFTTKVNDQLAASTMGEVYRIAKAEGFTSGKWLGFVHPDAIDGVWRRVCEGTVSGQLGAISAKVRESSYGDGRFVLCVYVADFSDRSQVSSLLRGLRALGEPMDSLPLTFKTDIATCCGVYTGQRSIYPGLDPALYRDSPRARSGRLASFCSMAVIPQLTYQHRGSGTRTHVSRAVHKPKQPQAACFKLRWSPLYVLYIVMFCRLDTSLASCLMATARQVQAVETIHFCQKMCDHDNAMEALCCFCTYACHVEHKAARNLHVKKQPFDLGVLQSCISCKVRQKLLLVQRHGPATLPNAHH